MRVLNPDQAGQLLAAIDLRDPFGPRDYNLLVLMLHTGLRVSEVVGLDVHHVAHEGEPRHLLFVPSTLGKGQRERGIPLNEAARDAVRQLLAFNRRRSFSTAPDAPLLVTRTHRRVSVRLIQRLVETLRERAGLDVPATPHTLRHSFATNVAQATGNLRIVQRLLGHKRLNTVEIYTHPTAADLEAAVASIVPEGGGAPCA